MSDYPRPGSWGFARKYCAPDGYRFVPSGRYDVLREFSWTSDATKDILCKLELYLASIPIDSNTALYHAMMSIMDTLNITYGRRVRCLGMALKKVLWLSRNAIGVHPDASSLVSATTLFQRRVHDPQQTVSDDEIRQFAVTITDKIKHMGYKVPCGLLNYINPISIDEMNFHEIKTMALLMYMSKLYDSSSTQAHEDSHMKIWVDLMQLGKILVHDPNAFIVGLRKSMMTHAKIEDDATEESIEAIHADIMGIIGL